MKPTSKIMLSDLRTGLIVAFVIFISLLSFTTHAQINKLDKAYGYSSYRFGTNHSKFAAILEQPDEDGRCRVKLSAVPELREIFGDSVRNIEFKFNDEHKLREIKIFYHNFDKQMDKDAANVFFSRIPNNITQMYGEYTSKRGMYPNMGMSWVGEKVYLDYTMSMTMGTWQRTVSISPLK